MVALLFKILIIQITIQLPMPMALEGRTTHYVRLLETPTSDDSAKRITCPVFAIRPANQTMKYFKYVVSETQFMKNEDWTTTEDRKTFAECANFAASNGYTMFLFDENECMVSYSLYTRLPEPCANETAVMVYMVEATENSCADQYLMSQLPGPACGRAMNEPVFCSEGSKYYKYVASQTQFTEVDDWTSIGSIESLEACGTSAALAGNTMFQFKENVCYVSNSIYSRLNESCNDETDSVVFMVEPPEKSCEGQYIVSELPGPACGASPNEPVFCDEGSKYYKYVVSQTQLAKAEDWTSIGSIESLEACGTSAALAGNKMFQFKENVCTVSNSIFTRLTESCNDETASVVYMVEPPENSCHGEHLMIDDSTKFQGSLCDSSPNLEIECGKGALTTHDAANRNHIGQIEGQCYIIRTANGNRDHEALSTICNAYGKESCKPTDSDSRATLVRHLFTIASTKEWRFSVDLAYDASSDTWIWRDTSVVQPTDDGIDEWGDLKSDFSSNPIAGMNKEGLSNFPTSENYPHTCCF